MPRLLIMACSATKADHPARAIDLYDGPAFRTLRAWMRNVPESEIKDLAVWILSAEHGLIPWDCELEPYDRRMTMARAEELRLSVTEKLAALVIQLETSEVFLMMGRVYLHAVGHSTWAGRTPIDAPPGGIGKKLGSLSRWLREVAA